MEDVIIEELDKYPITMNQYDFDRILNKYNNDTDIQHLIENVVFWKKKYANLNKKVQSIAESEIVNVLA